MSKSTGCVYAVTLFYGARCIFLYRGVLRRMNLGRLDNRIFHHSVCHRRGIKWWELQATAQEFLENIFVDFRLRLVVTCVTGNQMMLGRMAL